MSSPTGGTFRNYAMGSCLTLLTNQCTLALAAAESHESSYDAGKFAILTDSLEDALASLTAAADANGSGLNP